MYDDEKVKDSLEFIKGIEIYRQAELNKKKSLAEIIKECEQSSSDYSTERSEYSMVTQPDEERRKQKKRKKRPTSDTMGLYLLRNVFLVVICLIIGYGVASVLTTFVAHETKVEGESMEPTLSSGDSVIIQKISYYLSDPKRYDVVVFPVESIAEGQKEQTYYVKRIIGLPGEKVQIVDGKVYINDQLLESDTYCLSDILEAGIASSPVELGEDEYFVLGDNRNMSTDSRTDYVGMVHRSSIIGRVDFCIWPLNHFGSLPGNGD